MIAPLLLLLMVKFLGFVEHHSVSKNTKDGDEAKGEVVKSTTHFWTSTTEEEGAYLYTPELGNW